MQLKNKVLSFTLAAWFGLFSIIFIASEVYLKTEFYHLEQQFTRRGITRIQTFFQDLQQNLQNITESWAHWDISYQFAQQPSTQFKQQHLNTRVLERYKLNYAFIFNRNKQLIFQNSYNGQPFHSNRIKNTLSNELHDHTRSGFIQIDQTLYLICQTPILSSQKTGPLQGYLVIVRKVNDLMLQQLNDVTLSPTQLHVLDDQASTPQWTQISTEINQKNDNYLERNKNNHVFAYTNLMDWHNQAIALAEISIPTTITQQGYKVIYYYLIMIALLGLCLGLVVAWLIKHQVIARILSLSQQVIQIGMKRNYKERIKVDGYDELKQTATCINDMLQTIEVAQEQRVQERTQSLRELNRQLRQEISIRKQTESQLLESKEKLRHLAHHDDLTDLPNRALFDEVLGNAITKAERHSEELAILFVDLDRFKHINDAFGHHLGDEVLKIVATRFQSTLRVSDTIARQGGDEFIILLESFAKHEDIYRVAEKFLQCLRQPMEIHNREFVISASIGVSIYPSDGHSIEELTRKADMAMYQAKYSGGSNIHFYTEQMNVEAHERVMLEATLRQAINNDEFIAYYQPKVSLKTGKVIGTEALLRHKEYENSVVPAAQFIKLAEETGLIDVISHKVLSQACLDTNAWAQAGFHDLITSVNVSAIEFRNNDFVPNFLKIIQKHQIDPQKIEVELTESALIYDIKGAINKLTELNKAGFKIIVDDFETGYSSLNYLKEFPVDGLKIDKSFVTGLPHNRWDIAIVKAILTLAHNLDLMVVAEGVCQSSTT